MKEVYTIVDKNTELLELFRLDEQTKRESKILNVNGTLNPDFQKKVAAEMSRQFSDDLPESDRPQFLYHLGDMVYHFGEAAHYDQQFFSFYCHYPAPVFAIAGNYDRDVNPDSEVAYESLDAFKAVFLMRFLERSALAMRPTGEV